jgi:hypothetical protein
LGAGTAHTVAVTATLTGSGSHCQYAAMQPFQVAPCPPTSPPAGICLVSLAAALVALAIAGTGLAVGGCLGPPGAALMATSTIIGAGGIAALGLWIWLCHDCLVMRLLQRFFGGMAFLMGTLCVTFSMFGLAPCSLGAGAVGVLFMAIVATVSFGVAVFSCP